MTERALEISISLVETQEDISAVRELFREYAEFMGFELCFQGFDREMEGLPGVYIPPTGALLLCRVDGAPAGCVAFSGRALDVAELKRLYVRPAFRELKVGRNLALRAMCLAADAGYVAVSLETVPDRMEAAVALYERLGFETVPCQEGTDPRIVCYSRALAGLIV